MESIARTLTQPGASDQPLQLASSTVRDPERAPVADPKIPDYIEHYEVLRPLGEGGMGRVLLARDTKLGRLVAIKLLRHSGEAAARLLAEARATARARHENIVVLYEVGSFDGHPYMVLEYVEGRTLREVVSAARRGDGRALPRGFVLSIMASVLRALSAVHKSGIVHRDLKPENIMLLDTGQVKMLDFGIATHALPSAPLSLSTARPRAREGTRLYMSPEQWRGDPLDERSDLWAIGVILYELLTGVHPLAAQTPTSSGLVSAREPEAPIPCLSDVRPDLGGLSAVIERCLRRRPEERFRSADELLAALEPFLAGPGFAQDRALDRPFAGLAALQEGDADRFFGRERDVMAVLGSLERLALVAVAGASGAGKSSFVRAGVIPALRRGGEEWDVLVVRPGRAPVAALQEALAPARGDVDLRADPALFGAELRARCRAATGARRALVFVDQLEELYTLTPDADERAAFLACLLGAADDASSPLRVVLCVRSDFLDRAVDDRQFMTHLAAGLFFLPPMDAAGQREALTRTAEAAGYRFEDEAMIAGILGELARAKNPLPLLQFAAAKLWDARDPERRLLTAEAYAEMGGVGGALAAHADAMLAGLSATDQRLCRAIFLRLVTPERTRAVAYLRELSALGAEASAVESLVQRLASSRLVLVEADAEREGARVEIVHEALLDRWPTLERWLDESAGDAHFVARLRAAAAQWEQGGEPEGMLWRDRAAEEARAFYERHREGATEGRGALVGAVGERYIQAVIALADRSRRTRNRRVAAAFTAVLGVALGVFVLALDARRQARRADEEAGRVREQNTELARQALRGRDATRILAARKSQDDPTLALALLRELEAPDAARDWPELVSAALSAGVAADVWRSDPTRCAYAATMSPDGKQIAVAMDDRTTRILGADLVERARLLGHEQLVWTAAWSPDSKRVVTASFDATARIALADGSGEARVLRGHKEPLNSAVFSPDGRRVLTASDDKTARVWSAIDGRELVVLRHETEVQSAAWSPDGERIVTAGMDGVARVWSASGEGAPLLLRGHTDMIAAACFHPDGTRIATGSRDRTARIWSAQSGAELVTLRGHEEKVMSVAFSPGGERLATASKDKTARIWSADGRGSPIVLRGHKHWVYTAAWSPDGRQLITTSLDGTQRRWDVGAIAAPTQLRGHEDALRGLAFSPDSARIATCSLDGTARIWSADGSGEPAVLRDGGGPVTFVRWSPDGSRLATISEDKTARIRPVDGSAPPVVLRSPGALLQTLDWSPDGERVATAAADGTIRLWSRDGAEIASVKKTTSNEYKWIYAVFDRTGRRLLISDTSDSDVYLWDVGALGSLAVLGHHESPVRSAQWSPDGSEALTISNDGIARRWDVGGAAPPIEIRGPRPIRNGFWSPDGSRLVVALDDGSLRPLRGGELEPPIIQGVAGEGSALAAFRADGARILTFAPDGKVRVRSADGRGAPFVLTGSAMTLGHASWSPSGDRIAVYYEDKFAWVWPDARPLSGASEPRLWTATSYCVPPAIRADLLGVTEAEAREGEAACRRRASEARAAPPAP